LLLSQKKNVALRAGLFVVGFALAYSLVTYMDLVWIRYATPECVDLSYGVDIVWLKVGAHNPAWLETMKWLSYGAVSVCLGLTLWGIGSRKSGNAGSTDIDPRTMDAFRTGSGVYIGTFLLGANNDYRLIFLLFVIPQLAFWANRPSHSISNLSKLMILTIVFSLWHGVIDPFVPVLHLGFLGSLLYGMASWLTFGGLLFLFVCSLPEWVTETTKELFSWRASHP
jgi:hypothetical protein